MSSAEVIKVENLSKSYRVWRSPFARLWSPFVEGLMRLPFLPPAWRGEMERAAKSAGRDFPALSDVAFGVNQGESVGIIGRNGSGKSTLLHIITGTLRPTRGRATIRGRVAALLELGSGFNPEFTGRENAELNAALLGLTPREIREQMPAILAFADIGAFVDQPVKTYSSGMLVRLAFAVIAHIEADVLIIDEALAVGDVFFVQKCMNFLHRFRQEKVLLFVSHSLDAVTALCQKAIWLETGRIRRIGDAKEVTEAYLQAFFEASGRSKAGEDLSSREMGAALTIPHMGPREIRDQRLQFLNHSPLRNDLEVFTFDPQAPSFGERGGSIVEVRMLDQQGRDLAWIVGGEIVVLSIVLQAAQRLVNPIVGFYVKNALGQQLFGDNTFFTMRGQESGVEAGDRFEARFTFQMPILPPGDYSIAPGLADGTQAEHIMHHWMHDGLAFRARTSPLRAGGLVGLPMLEIDLRRIAE